MANVKTLEERFKKLEEERKKLAIDFGEKVIDVIDVTTPSEFEKFLKSEAGTVNELLNEWREERQKPKNTSEENIEYTP